MGAVLVRQPMWERLSKAASYPRAAFVGATIPDSAHARFAHIEGLPQHLHMTLLYVPEGPKDRREEQAILRAVRHVAQRTPPLRCKITGIGIVGQGSVLAALVTVENGAKLHADLVATIADGELDRALERTYDFLPHITLSHQPAEEAAAADLRKVRWTTKSITVQFGKRGKVHRFYLKGRPSKLRVLMKAAQRLGLFEEHKHPRYPKGHPKGGRFMLTGRRAEGGEAPVIAPAEPEAADFKHTYYSPWRPWHLGAGSRLQEDLPPEGQLEYVPESELPPGMLAGVRTTHPLSEDLVMHWELEEEDDGAGNSEFNKAVLSFGGPRAASAP